MTKEPFLTRDQIEGLVQAKLKEYEKLSVEEQYVRFMGKSQILEFALKGLFSRKYDVPSEDMEKWTLGKTKTELENKGLRSDFISLLQSVVDHRNFMAHEFLINTAITKSLADFSGRKVQGPLFRAIYELEQLIILYDWNEEHNAW